MFDDYRKTGAETEIAPLPTTLRALDGELAALRNESGQIGTPAPGQPPGKPSQELERVYSRINRTRSQIEASIARLNYLEEVIALRAAEANLHAAVVNSWPPATATCEILLFGVGLFGAGCAAYVTVGYPPLDPRIVPPVGLWVLRLGLILWGLNRLIKHDRMRWANFEGTPDFPRM